MKRIRIMLLGGAAVVTIAGVGIAGASSGPSTASTSVRTARVMSQIHALEQRAAAAGNTTALAALQKAEVSLQARQAAAAQEQGQPATPPPPCPSSAPNAGHPQPCGKSPTGTPKPCPSPAPNHGGTQPCGSPSPTPTGTGTGTPAACGAADSGGTAAAGPISGPLYGIGLQISNGGGAPLGDAVQEIACAVYENLTL